MSNLSCVAKTWTSAARTVIYKITNCYLLLKHNLMGNRNNIIDGSCTVDLAQVRSNANWGNDIFNLKETITFSGRNLFFANKTYTSLFVLCTLSAV